MQEKAADFAGAVVLDDELKLLNFLADAEHLRFVNRGLDAVSVKRLKSPHLGDDAAGSDELYRS